VASAVYPGTFDPVTNGHLDLVERGAKLFDRLLVAVAVNPAKAPLFEARERVEMIRGEVSRFRNVEVDSFVGLVVDYAKRKRCEVILRGLRTISDFEYEYQMALTNRTFSREVETVFVMPNEKFSFISSRLIKEAVAMGGDVSSFLPPAVERGLRERLRRVAPPGSSMD
jgi:pantetheine-phosphate adenylyltransferase